MLSTLYYTVRDRWHSPDSSGVWKWRLKLIVSLAIPIFLETLDYTVVATAQTNIASTFNRLDIQSYIGTVYLLTSTVFLPFFASIADIYGRHFALQLSLVFFVAGSAISTASFNMETMLAGRAIAGIGAAGLITVVRIILADSSSLDENNWQVSIMFLLYAVGYSAGPVIGGALVDVTFRWIFAINLPASVLAMALCFLLLRKDIKGPQPPKRLPLEHSPKQNMFFTKLLLIDWVGTTLFIGGGVLILLALNWGSTGKWEQAEVIAGLVVGVLMLVVCLFWEHLLERQESMTTPPKYQVLRAEPMLPLEIFKSYDISATMFGSFVSGMIMIVMFYFVAIFMTIVAGLSPRDAGVQLIYFAPGMGAGTLIAIRLTSKTKQPKYAIWWGSLIAPISLGFISMAIDQERQSLVNGFLVLAGVSTGLTSGSLAVHARFSQPDHRVAVVSSLATFSRSFGGTLGLAQCATVTNAVVLSELKKSIASLRLGDEALGHIDTGSVEALSSLELIKDFPEELQAIIRAAFREGTRWAFLSMVPWAAISVILVYWLTDIKMSESGDEYELTNQNQAAQMGGSTGEKPDAVTRV